MLNGADHAANCRCVVMLDDIIRSAESERFDRALMIEKRIVHAFSLFDTELLHLCYPLKTFESEIPLRSAVEDASERFSSADIVAFTKLCGFDEPCDFVRISCTPASSSTARTPPPAISPVPGEAGLRKTLPA